MIPELHKQYEWWFLAYYRGAFYHEVDAFGFALFVRRRNSKHGSRRIVFYRRGQ